MISSSNKQWEEDFLPSDLSRNSEWHNLNRLLYYGKVLIKPYGGPSHYATGHPNWDGTLTKYGKYIVCLLE